MSDKPILFSPPMVRALLAGTKTQTRRVAGVPTIEPMENRDGWHIHNKHGGDVGVPFEHVPASAADYLPIQPGDRLWVRESVQAAEQPSGLDGYLYPADGEWAEIESSKDAAERWVDRFHYASKARGRPKGNVGHMIPSIHMPKELSRITLHVTDARVQRLQDISEEDAKAEGVDEATCYRQMTGRTGDEAINPPLVGPIWALGYERLWNAINGAGAWDENPWVAAYTFEVERCNIAEARKP